MSDGRKADRVANDLMAALSRGARGGGHPPKEADLAEEYRVNRSVVREAVKLLEVHRLVRPVKRRGTEVLDPFASLSPEVLRKMLEPAPGKVDRETLSDLLEVRAQLDEQMCSLAAIRRTDADLASLERCLEQLQANAHDSRSFMEAVDDMSVTIARATQNRIFQMLVQWNRMVSSDLIAIFSHARKNSPTYVQGLGPVGRVDPPEGRRANDVPRPRLSRMGRPPTLGRRRTLQR